MILLKLLTWLIPISINIYLDRNGAKRNYLQVFIIRAIIAILHGAWMLPTDFNYSAASSLQLILIWLPFLIFQITSYWLLFEIGLNAVRGNGILYYDTKESDSGWVDRLFKWAGWKMHLIAKIFSFIIMVLSIIVIYNR
jgi:hypothetical protein